MFKLKKISNTDMSKFIGVSFTYQLIEYKITSFGIHDVSGQPCFFLDDFTTRRVEVNTFHENIKEGEFKIIKNVSV
jgi:hypothetical protein